MEILSNITTDVTTKADDSIAVTNKKDSNGDTDITLRINNREVIIFSSQKGAPAIEIYVEGKHDDYLIVTRKEAIKALKDMAKQLEAMS